MATMTIEDLFPELLLKIFSHYIESEGHMRFSRNIIPVCRAWRSLSSTPSLWKSVNVQDWSFAGLLSLSERGFLHHTRSLKIPDRCTSNPFLNPASLDPFLLLTVLPHLHELKALEISNNSIDADTMNVVAVSCPNLEHLHMENVSCGKFESITLKELDPILATCGPKLKHLRFSQCKIEDGEQLFAQVAAKCTSLEVFQLQGLHLKFPIHKFANGCRRLRKLVLDSCDFVTADENSCSGLEDLTVFKAYRCNFHGLNVCSLLRNSKNLENLDLNSNDGLVFSDISNVPSNKVRFLNIGLHPTAKDINLVVLRQAVRKWKHAVSHFRISGWKHDITSVLKIFLDTNQCPKLEVLGIEKDSVDRNFFITFIQKSRNLKELELQDSGECYGNREEVMMFRDSLSKDDVPYVRG